MQGDPANAPPRPSVGFHVSTGVWAVLATLMLASLGRFLLSGIVVLFGVMLGVAWFFAFARVLVDREARGRLTWKEAGHWAVCPATGLFFVALSFTTWPYMLRVTLSEPALLRLVEDLDQGRANPFDPGRAGLIFVDHAEALEDCVVLTTETGFLTEYGLVYSRDDSPPDASPRWIWHLYGRWYAFAYDPF
jgi:hypothetical protein